MKATIIGSDLLQKNDSVKFLEINTNTTIYNEGADLLDYTSLFDMLTTNNITEFHFIWTETDAYKPLTEQFRFKNILEEKCIENNITFQDYIVPVGSVTIPFIEDATNKFILRQAFDTTALVDETYCADKFEFFSLMSGSQYIPKTYFTSDIISLDSLDEVDFTSTNPNFLIKARYPNYDNGIYPSLYKVMDITELTTLKNQLESNYLAQEFIFSEDNLIEGRYSIIRSIDIIYGSELDVISLGGYTQSTIIPISFSADEFVSGTNKLNQKSRYKYITKDVSSNSGKTDYHTDDDSMIVNFNGTLTDVDTIQIGDYIRSIDFIDSNDNHAANLEVGNLFTLGWDSTLQQSNDTLTQMSSSLEGKTSVVVDTIYIRITLEDGRTWTDSPSCTYYIEEKDSTLTRFEKVNKLYVGDKLVITDVNTNELTTVTISGLEMEYAQKTIYSLDFEPSDLFLVDVGDGDFSVMHNGCWCPNNGCGYWCYSSYCAGCGFQPPAKL
jgi:hypothetical protein